MARKWEKVTAIILAAGMALSAAGCGSAGGSGAASKEETTASQDTAKEETAAQETAEEETAAPEETAEAETEKEEAEEPAGGVEGKHCTIGVALYSDSGPQGDGIKAYLSEIADDLNVDFKYTVLTQTDEAANLTKMQELISSGVDGVICTMDLGTKAILDECQAAGVYMAGYLCDYDNSYTNDHDSVFKNEYFLGTVADGACCAEDVTLGQDYLDSLIEYNERNPEAPLTHVSLAGFPSWAFPLTGVAIEQFEKAVEEYNKDAEVQITVDPLNEESDILQFTAMDSTYFSKHEGIQAIMCFASSYFAYSTMVSSGVDKDIKLFSSGYDPGSEEYFGTTGAGTIQQSVMTAIESINYPLVLLLNEINGVEFKDQPEEAQRVSTSEFILNSDEDMELFKKNVYFTGKGEDAMFTGADVLQMTAYGNPDATYEGLAESMKHLTVEDLA